MSEAKSLGTHLPARLSRRGGFWAILLGFALLGACAPIDDRRDYHRHSMSDLREDWRQPGIFLFEASTSSLYPPDSEAAEAVRMEWLAAWMKRSGYCPAGWKILSRSAIDPGEVHARRHDLRYMLECAETSALTGN